MSIMSFKPTATLKNKRGQTHRAATGAVTGQLTREACPLKAANDGLLNASTTSLLTTEMCIITVVAHSRLHSLVWRHFSRSSYFDVNIILFSRIPEYLVESQWCKEAPDCFLRHTGHVKSWCIWRCLVSGKFPRYSSHAGSGILK